MHSRRELLTVVLLAVAACDAGESAAPGGEPRPPADTAQAPDDVTGVAAWKTLSDRPCPPESALTYDNFGSPFFLTWCTGCHGADLSGIARRGAPSSVTFDDIESIRSREMQIWLRAADTNATMPPSGGPDALERAQLGEWLACGAR